MPALVPDPAVPPSPLAASPGPAASSAAADGGIRPVRWPAAAGLILSVAGLAVAGYLTFAHYDTAVKLACPDTGLVNCLQVTTSTYSLVVGVPVALLGLLFFAAMVPLNLPVAWQSTNRWLRAGRLAATVVGMGFVIWLVYAELFGIGKICLYCTGVHALTFALFVVTALGTVATSAIPQD